MEEKNIIMRLDKQDEILAYHSKKFDELGGRLDNQNSKIDKNTAKLDEHGVKLDEHSALLDQHTVILDQHSVTLAQHSVKLDKLSNTQDKIINKLLDLDTSLEETKERLTTVEIKVDSIVVGQDEILKILRRSEQEEAASILKINRLEERVDSNEKRISSIAVKLQIS